MPSRPTLAVLALVPLGLLAACDDTTGSDAQMQRSGTAAAETACAAAVNRSNGVDSGAIVTSSEASEAGSLVMLSDDSRTTWRCLASDDGTVETLTGT